MSRIVAEFIEEVVERRSVMVREVERHRADLSLWHGGRRIDEHSAHPSAEEAIRKADAVARHYGIGPDSTLHLRVERKAVRERETSPCGSTGEDWLRHQAGRTERTLQVERRHVWDSHAGDMASTVRSVTFEVVQWIGFRDEACDPGNGLATYFVAAEADVSSPDDLWSGFGTGAASIVSVARAEETPGHIDRKGVHHWARVAITGTLDVFVPRGFTAPLLNDFLGACNVRVERCRHSMGKLPDRWDHYVGEPASSFRWLPLAALPAPAASLT